MSFKVPVPWPVEINLSRGAMAFLIHAIPDGADISTHGWTEEIGCELDNFCNLLQNLLDRETENLDLIGD